jgi:hypothetical protein
MSWAVNKGRKGLSQHNKLHGVYDTSVQTFIYECFEREEEERMRQAKTLSFA